jgi:hypothetical protein
MVKHMILYAYVPALKYECTEGNVTNEILFNQHFADQSSAAYRPTRILTTFQLSFLGILLHHEVIDSIPLVTSKHYS